MASRRPYHTDIAGPLRIREAGIKLLKNLFSVVALVLGVVCAYILFLAIIQGHSPFQIYLSQSTRRTQRIKNKEESLTDDYRDVIGRIESGTEIEARSTRRRLGFSDAKLSRMLE